MRHPLNATLSVYLDLVRFTAALAVFLEHANFDRVSGGLPVLWRLADHGSDAVMVFFVLSGFVIAHVAEHKEHSGREYLLARLARLWSVALPALLITAVVDPIGAAVWPAVYDGWWYQADHPAWRLAANAFFVNELWFSSIRPLSNGPFWSLGYEFVYYLLFAAAHYLQGWRRAAAMALVIVAAGPKIMVLAPVWWLGVWAYRTTLPQRLSAAAGVAWMVLPVIAFFALQRAGLLALLDTQVGRWLGEPFTTEALHRSQAFLSSTVVGVLVTVHFVGARALSLHWNDPFGRLAPMIRRWAALTFPLYLLHYPLLHLLAAIGWRIGLGRAQAPVVAMGTLCIAGLIGPWCERQKAPLRRWLGERTGLASSMG